MDTEISLVARQYLNGMDNEIATGVLIYSLQQSVMTT